jgi:hypothetical protein
MHCWIIRLVCLFPRAGEDLPICFNDGNVVAIRFQLLLNKEVKESFVLV